MGIRRWFVFNGARFATKTLLMKPYFNNSFKNHFRPYWGGGGFPFGGGFDPDALAFFTAIEEVGGTLSENLKNEWNAFVIREKNANRYAKLKRLYPYLGGVIDSAIVDAITLFSPTNFNFVDLDVDSLIGLQGGVGKYLRDTYSSYEIFAGQFNWGGYILQIISNTRAGDTFAWGDYEAPYGQMMYTRRGGGSTSQGRGNDLSITVSSTILNNGESLSVNRSGTELLQIFKNGTIKNSNSSIDGGFLSNSGMCYFVSSNGEGIIAGFNPSKVGCIALWSGFNDADVSGFDESYKTFLTQIGAI